MDEFGKTCPFCCEPTGGRVCGICLQAVELMSRVTVTRARLQLIERPRCEVVTCSKYGVLKLRKVMGSEETVLLCEMCHGADRVYRTDGFGLRAVYGF